MAKKIIVLFLAQFIICLACNAYSQDASLLIKEYQKCNSPQECNNIELKIIKSLISRTKIRSVLEKVPDVKDIKYKIIKCNISGSKEDYAIKMVYDRLGYVAFLVKDSTQKYKSLPIIKTGYIFDIESHDVTGDGLDVIIVKGQGTGTGYESKWTALYKFRNLRMDLIWSGVSESDSLDENGIEIKHNYNIFFITSKDNKSKDIIQQGKLIKIDTKTNTVLDEKNIEKKFIWSTAIYKYVMPGSGSGDKPR